tara:strand:- start:10589 stop:11173 length:585 start_codon:yes stop_codon:yes gene_type:complete
MIGDRSWLLCVLDIVFELGDPVFQKYVWKQGIGPFMSCQTEAICGFEDYSAPLLINDLALCEKLGLSPEDQKSLAFFAESLDEYNNYTAGKYTIYTSDEIVLSDPKWILITKHAQELRDKLWPFYKRLCEESASDADEVNREGVLLRLWVPSRIVEKLIKDPSPKVAERAYEKLKKQKLLEEWHKDTDFMNGWD